ncbi:hypothetical protein [Enterovirga aerilata]|uniref:Lipoprotein n=1 Tax=Enterovirga aerilata TaxID=2730920 RepID=A0A849I209_9HYPH|nr:hypothetical protein [Enterovirga sp. DB1703]NNM71391.1 hypothetical protein [Enterovirga sp. DB1703]
MRIITLIGLLVAGSLLAGCQSSSGDDAMGDLSSSMSGALGRDTYGTNRRMDVYGGATAPTLPTIGAPGYGK